MTTAQMPQTAGDGSTAAELTGGDGGGPPDGRGVALSGWALGTAVAVLIAFTVLVVFMIVSRNADEVTWARLSWIFASVEAIAFGAAGALFGASIQRQRAETAEANAAENATAASNGSALAAALKAEAPEQATTPSGKLRSLGPRDNASEADRMASRHAKLAEALFPNG